MFKRSQNCDASTLKVVHELLISIAQSASDRKNDYACVRFNGPERDLLNRRLLAAFGRCTFTPLFTFDLSKTSLRNWLTLYSTPIRCALDDCNGTGFVLLDFWVLEDGVHMGHACALFVDRERNLQCLIDPSGDLAAIDGLEFFRYHHIWGDETTVLTYVDEGRQQPSLQSFFSNFIDSNDPDEVGNCCTSIVILVVWFCLRLGCRDPQYMVDHLRCVMESKRVELSKEGYHALVVDVLAWHTDMTKKTTDEQFLQWLQLTALAGSVKCNCIRYDENWKVVDFCQRRSSPSGSVWCAEHASERNPWANGNVQNRGFTEEHQLGPIIPIQEITMNANASVLVAGILREDSTKVNGDVPLVS